GLAAGCFPFHEQCVQTIGGAINRRCQACRTSADNDQIVEGKLRLGFKPNLWATPPVEGLPRKEPAVKRTMGNDETSSPVVVRSCFAVSSVSTFSHWCGTKLRPRKSRSSLD